MCCKIVFNRSRKQILNPLQQSLRSIYGKIIIQTKVRATKDKNDTFAIHNFLICILENDGQKKNCTKSSLLTVLSKYSHFLNIIGAILIIEFSAIKSYQLSFFSYFEITKMLGQKSRGRSVIVLKLGFNIYLLNAAKLRNEWCQFYSIRLKIFDLECDTLYQAHPYF